MHRASLIAVLLLGCAKSPEQVASTPAQAARTLDCPPGTEEAGAPPPEAFELYCFREDIRSRRIKHGPYRRWHDVDTLAESGTFYEGKRHGRWTEVNPSGATVLEAQYVEGEADGPWTAYHPSGARSEVGEYRMGQREGHWQFFDNHERLQREGTYVDGVEDGLWVFYGPSGDPSIHRTYRRGRLVSQTEL